MTFEGVTRVTFHVLSTHTKKNQNFIAHCKEHKYNIIEMRRVDFSNIFFHCRLSHSNIFYIFMDNDETMGILIILLHI